jgi:hypothetical protein
MFKNHLFSSRRQVPPTERRLGCGEFSVPCGQQHLNFADHRGGGGKTAFRITSADTAEHKPSLLLRYVDDTCVIWPHGLDSLQEFCYHINSLIPTFKITMEIETDSANPLFDVLVIRERTTMNTKIYRKPTHTGRYLHFQSNRPPHVKRGTVQSLYHRVNIMYQEQQVRSDEIVTLKLDLQLSAYRNGCLLSTNPREMFFGRRRCSHSVLFLYLI